MTASRDEPVPQGTAAAVPDGNGKPDAQLAEADQPDHAEQPEPEEQSALPLEQVTAFGVEGYDPEDPWNAALCVETENVAGLLPLTPKTLGALLGALGEVDGAQRGALGVPAGHPPEGHSPEEEPEEDAPGVAVTFAHRARSLTGSAQLGRLWGEPTRGRLIVIGGAVLFIVLGILFSTLR